MAPRATRSKNTTAPTASDIPTLQITRTEDEPHKMFILPQNASDEARMVLLQNPANPIPSRYFYCPQLGLYEFTKVSSPRMVPRSCLIAAETECQTRDDGQVPEHSWDSMKDGYLLQDADFLVATPLDPVFLLIPLLQSPSTTYRQADDYLDQLAETSTHMEQLLHDGRFRSLLVKRLKVLSDVQDIGGGEEVYKLQLGLLADLMIEKAGRAVGHPWPASMEDGLVRRELEIPVTVLHAEEEENIHAPNAADEILPIADQNLAVVLKDGVKSSDLPPNVLTLMRQRTTLDYLTSRYIPPPLRTAFEALLLKSKRIDFEPLTQHLDRVKTAKADVQALRALSDNISRKRSMYDDEEAAEARAEKKRKKEEEESKKKAESRAIKQLKKVDTSGMKKMSSFFTKATPKTCNQKT